MQSFFHVLLPAFRRPRFPFFPAKGVLPFGGRYPNRRLCSSTLALCVCLVNRKELPGSCVDLRESCEELLDSSVDLRESCEELLDSCVDLRESCEELLESCVDLRESCKELPDPDGEYELPEFCEAVPCALS